MSFYSRGDFLARSIDAVFFLRAVAVHDVQVFVVGQVLAIFLFSLFSAGACLLLAVSLTPFDQRRLRARSLFFSCRWSFFLTRFGRFGPDLLKDASDVFRCLRPLVTGPRLVTSSPLPRALFYQPDP